MKIRSQIKTSDPTFKENHAFHSKQRELFLDLVKTAKLGGGEKAQQNLKDKGKLNPRERIKVLQDKGSDFLELSCLAGYELYENEYIPSAGIVTGIVLVHGRPCVVVANDPTVKGGTYYPATVKKHLRAQEIAEKNHLPCIYLVDSGGAFLPEQAEVFPDKDDFGRIFFNQARMSAKGISQISAVHGFCTAGGAYIPAMSDQSVIVDKTGTIFLAGPPLVKAATGEDVTAEELGGARVHTQISGVADHFAKDDTHALLILREIIKREKLASPQSLNLQTPKDPAYDPAELLGVLPCDSKTFVDSREIIARIVDGSELFEFRANYATTLVTGFAHLGGMPVGIIANNGVLFSESALKATHFIELCCKDNIPLLFLQNITGFIVGKQYEHGGIAKDGAKMVHAVATANVPKLTLITGGSFGAGNYGMCGRAYDPNFMFSWPHSKIGVMGGEQAAQVLVTVKNEQRRRENLAELSPQEQEQLKAPILAKYAKESSAYYATARLWDDGILDPLATRSTLIQALGSTLFYKWPETKHGVLRM